VQLDVDLRGKLILAPALRLAQPPYVRRKRLPPLPRNRRSETSCRILSVPWWHRRPDDQIQSMWFEQERRARILTLPFSYVHSMQCQKFATVFRPNTNAFGFVLVPPGSITYWMFGRTCRPGSGR
jgi:hypothetical protein